MNAPIIATPNSVPTPRIFQLIPMVASARTPTTRVIIAIRKGIDITPIDTPFEYVKDLQSNFPYEQIPFTNEYYDTLGIERPDGTEPEENGFEFRAVEITVDKN